MTEIRELQKKVNTFVKKNNLSTNPDILMIDLTSEIGELSKEVIKSTDYGRHKNRKITSETEYELGDVLFCLIRLAKEMNVDLNVALNKVLKKYEERAKKNKAKRIGSGR